MVSPEKRSTSNQGFPWRSSRPNRICAYTYPYISTIDPNTFAQTNSVGEFELTSQTWRETRPEWRLPGDFSVFLPWTLKGRPKVFPVATMAAGKWLLSFPFSLLAVGNRLIKFSLESRAREGRVWFESCSEPSWVRLGGEAERHGVNRYWILLCDVGMVMPAYHEEGRLGSSLDRISGLCPTADWGRRTNCGGWRLAGSYRRHCARLCQEEWDCPPAGDAAKPRQGLRCCNGVMNAPGRIILSRMLICRHP